VVLAGIGLNFLFTSTGSSWALSPQQLVNIPSNIFASMQFPDLSQLFVSGQIWKDGILIGLLATLETLLCIEAVDKLDRHNRITPVNRELVAQGVGNMACGFLGAIPLTAVVVRGAANVDAGARTKLSAVTHGAFLLLAVLLIPSVLNKIPYASLGGILLVTGYNLAKPKLFKNMRSLGWKQFLPFLITIIIILSTDLLIGVSIGLLLSVYFIIQNNFKAEYKITRSHHLGKETELIKLNSNVTFLNKVKLKKTLDEVPENTVLTIDGSECNFIDYDILEIISEYDNKARDRNIELHLKGIKKVSVTAVH
jgi:MFS superfamily sulfate permease-like transporter